MRIFTLDYLRGIAAIGIMFYHYSVWNYGLFGSETVLGKIGIYGVSVFYVLSGLTLFLVYHDQFTISKLKPFFIKRVSRIFPLLWASIFLTIILLGKNYEIQKILLNITGIFGFVAHHQYIPTGAWSIGNELVFYSIFPIALFVTNKSRYGLEAIFGLTVLIATYFSFYRLPDFEVLAPAWKTYINPFNQVYLFVGGMLLAKYFKGKKLPYAAILCLILGLLIFVPVIKRGDLLGIISGAPRLIYSLGCFLVCGGALLLGTVRAGMLHRPLKVMGDASYSIYLLHPIVYWSLLKWFPSIEKDLFLFVISVLVSLIFSVLTYYAFERKFIDLGRKWSGSQIPLKKMFKYSAFIFGFGLIVLQSNKLNQQLDSKRAFEQLLKNSPNPYIKLLRHRSIYADSIYKVYIANIKDEKQLIFVAKDSLSEIQRESKFFVHVYPIDSTLLKKGVDHLAYDFKNNVREFDISGKKYFVSSQALPNLKIKKLNLGQYGYSKDNSITWRIDHLLIGTEIARTLRENKEDMQIFEYVPETF